MTEAEDIELQRKNAVRGEDARRILESPLWQESWAIYETRLLEQFKACRSDDRDQLQQLKMLHLAGLAARMHLESVIADGKFAVKDLEFKEKRGVFKLFKGRI